jgi:hypothetical protein
MSRHVPSERHQDEVLVQGCGRVEQQARSDRLPAEGTSDNDGETMVETRGRVLAVLVRTGMEELAAVRIGDGDHDARQWFSDRTADPPRQHRRLLAELVPMRGEGDRLGGLHGGIFRGGRGDIFRYACLCLAHDLS